MYIFEQLWNSLRMIELDWALLAAKQKSGCSPATLYHYD